MSLGSRIEKYRQKFLTRSGDSSVYHTARSRSRR